MVKSWQEIRVLLKQGLIGVGNDYIAASWGNLKPQILRMAVLSGGILESHTAQQIQVLGDAGTCLIPQQ